MIATSSDSRDSWDGASWLKEASASAAGSTTQSRQLTRDLPAFPIHKVKIVVESGSFSSLGDGGFEFSNFSGRLVWVREDGQGQEGEDAQVGSHNGNLAIASGKKAATHESDSKNDEDDEDEDDDDEDDDEDEEDEEAYALEAEEEEEENTFLTRFMQRSGSIGEKIMMMRTLSPMSGKEGKGLGAVAEHDEDGHGRDAIGGGSHEDESMDSGVDRITKVQARWHRAAQRHPTSIQKVLRGERTNERNEQNERIKRNERTNEPMKS